MSASNKLLLDYLRASAHYEELVKQAYYAQEQLLYSPYLVKWHLLKSQQQQAIIPPSPEAPPCARAPQGRQPPTAPRGVLKRTPSRLSPPCARAPPPTAPSQAPRSRGGLKQTPSRLSRVSRGVVERPNKIDYHSAVTVTPVTDEDAVTVTPVTDKDVVGAAKILSEILIHTVDP